MIGFICHGCRKGDHGNCPGGTQWKKNGLVQVPRNQVLDSRHVDYFTKYAKLVSGPAGANLSLRWIPGHTGDPMNELVDGLARLASRSLIDKLEGDDIKHRADELAKAFYEYLEKEAVA